MMVGRRGAAALVSAPKGSFTRQKIENEDEDENEDDGRRKWAERRSGPSLRTERDNPQPPQ